MPFSAGSHRAPAVEGLGPEGIPGERCRVWPSLRSHEPVRVNVETGLVRLFPFHKCIPAKPTWMVSINTVSAGGHSRGCPPVPTGHCCQGAAGTALKTHRELAAYTRPRSGWSPAPAPAPRAQLPVSSSGLLVFPSAHLHSLYPRASGSSPVCPKGLGSPAEALMHLSSSLSAHLCIAEGLDGECVCEVEEEAGCPETSASPRGMWRSGGGGLPVTLTQLLLANSTSNSDFSNPPS